MSLIVETGAGIAGAESYASVAFIDAFWAARTHDPRSALWTALGTPEKEGAAREASDYCDATWGAFYRGQRAGRMQGRLWPRTSAFDEADYPLPPLPDELPRAVAELAPRAAEERLAPDLERGGQIKQESSGVDGAVRESVTYVDGAPVDTRYGMVVGILAPILNGSQPGAPVVHWSWR